MFHYTAHGWLALTVTDSAFWVGAFSALGGLSIILFSTISGVLADRLNRKFLILATQVCQACVAVSLAFLIFTGQIGLWHILVGSFIDGAMVSIRVPSRMALMVDVAGRRNIQKAMAANFAAMTGTGIIIPPLAGRLIETHGIGWAYVSMAVALTLSVLMLTFMKASCQRAKSDIFSISGLQRGCPLCLYNALSETSDIADGNFRAVWLAHESMIPVMAGRELNAGPSGLGFIIAAGSTGALLSSILLSSIGDIRRKGLALICGYIGFGTFLILFAMSTSLILSLILIAVAYASVAMYGNYAGHALADQRPK